METSTAVLLPPEDTDDKAPPTACRTREKMSQGYGRVSDQYCLFRDAYRMSTYVCEVTMQIRVFWLQFESKGGKGKWRYIR